MARLTLNNHTGIPNEFIDEYMGNLSPVATIVFIAICRKTAGWHKEKDRISTSQIVKTTGLSKNSVLKAVKILEDNDLITVHRCKDSSGYNEINVYDIGYFVRNEETPVHSMGGGGAGGEPRVVQEMNHGVVQEMNPQNKEILNKKNISIDDSMFEDFWNKYQKKVGKDRTFKFWNKLTPEEKQKAIDMIPAYHSLRPDPTYRLHPERYLSQKTFNEEVLIEQKQKKKFKDYL